MKLKDTFNYLVIYGYIIFKEGNLTAVLAKKDNSNRAIAQLSQRLQMVIYPLNCMLIYKLNTFNRTSASFHPYNSCKGHL